jgi:hypothetical protein
MWFVFVVISAAAAAAAADADEELPTPLTLGVMGPTLDSFCKFGSRVCLESQIGGLSLAVKRATDEGLLRNVDLQ